MERLIEFSFFMMLLMAPINLPAFYFFFSATTLLALLQYRLELIQFITTDRLFLVLVGINTLFLFMPLEISSQSLRVWGKFSFIFVLLPVLKFLSERSSLNWATVYLVGATCSSFIYILEKMIPVVPKLSYGDMSAAGIAGSLFVLCIAGHISKTKSLGVQALILIIFLNYLAAHSLLLSVASTVAMYFICLTAILYIVTQSEKSPLIQALVHFFALLSLEKRGPLLGAIAGVMTLLGLLRARITILLFAVAIIGVLLTPNLRHRFSELLDYQKALSDPRVEMWKTGLEIARSNPLGIGYGKADILREIMSERFSNFKHFHSNYVNILVENGFSGLIVFVVFLGYIILKAAPPTRALFLYLAVTGLFESNYIDSEFLINFCIIATLSTRLSPRNDEYPGREKIGYNNV